MLAADLTEFHEPRFAAPQQDNAIVLSGFASLTNSINACGRGISKLLAGFNRPVAAERFGPGMKIPVDVFQMRRTKSLFSSRYTLGVSAGSE